MSPRLSVALDTGALTLPRTGELAVFFARDAAGMAVLPKDRTLCIQPFRPDFDTLVGQGYRCVASLDPELCFSAGIVLLPRAKALARASIAQAVDVTTGMVVIDGAKTDGIDSILKDLRKRTEIIGQMSKAHGRIFWFESGAIDLADWRPPARQGFDGFQTAPGVFSADGADPASIMLAGALPEKFGRHVADLGAGWGYLSNRVLQDPSVETLDLVEADRTALDCARINVCDGRARFHWADATSWAPEGQMDIVVMNPPFHTSRRADPSLGQAFVVTAARILKPAGNLWLVANRHLPYETTLSENFTHAQEIAGDARFKVLHASRPRR